MVSFAAQCGRWPFLLVTDRMKASRTGKLMLVEDRLNEYSRNYTWAELTAKQKPKGLDNSRLESYLSDEEFKERFGTTKEDFYKLPGWRRVKKKKDLKFF